MSLLRDKAFSAIESAPSFASGDRSRRLTPVNTRVAVLLDDSAEVEELGFLSTEEWQLTRRVAKSKLFAKSDLLQKFLLHVCELALRGLAHEITEQRIGTQIFHRPADYNPGEDNIVRSYARTLRKRLEQYFAEEGRDEPRRIIIPRGGYVPVFECAQAETEADGAGALTNDAESPLSPPELQHAQHHPPSNLPILALPPPPGPVLRAPSRWLMAAFSLATAFVLGALLASAIIVRLRPATAAKEQSAAHVVWEQLFQPNHNTLIVPADSGLGIVENLSGHQVSVEEYANSSYLSDMKAPSGLDAGNFNDLRRQRYTSVADLNITAELMRLPEYLAARTQIRYARGITVEDLKGANVILIGSKHANPWVELFEKRLNFRLEYASAVDESWVINENLQGAEQKIYRNGTDAAFNHTYGTASYLLAPDGNGHVLILQGLNMAATQAAAEVMFNPQIIRPILQQATLPNGRLRPFELLVETSSVGATDPEAHIIATRFY
jgi:hypothetical protein